MRKTGQPEFMEMDMDKLIAALEAALPILRMACERGIPEASDALEQVSAALADVKK